MARAGGNGKRRTVISVTTPNIPFRSDEQSDQVEAGLVFMDPPTGADNLTAGQHHFETDDVMTSNAIFKATRAPGVCGHISANRAVMQARGIRRIKQPLRANRALQLASDHPRLQIAIASPAWISLIRFIRAKESAIPPFTGTQLPTYP